jgi:hypothetical protein
VEVAELGCGIGRGVQVLEAEGSQVVDWRSGGRTTRFSPTRQHIRNAAVMPFEAQRQRRSIGSGPGNGSSFPAKAVSKQEEVRYADGAITFQVKLRPVALITHRAAVVISE